MRVPLHHGSESRATCSFITARRAVLRGVSRLGEPCYVAASRLGEPCYVPLRHDSESRATCRFLMARRAVLLHHLLEHLALLDHGGDAVVGVGAAFQQDPAGVVHLDEQLDQLRVGIVADVQLADVGGGAEAVLDQVEVVLQALRRPGPGRCSSSRRPRWDGRPRP